MKGKFNSLWRVGIAVSLIVSLSLMLATPSLAAGYNLTVAPNAPERVFVCDDFTFELQVCNTGDEFADEVLVEAAMAEGFENAVFLLDGGGTALEWAVSLGDVCPGTCKTAHFPMKCVKPGTAEIDWEVFVDGVSDDSGSVSIDQMCKLGVEITDPTDGDSYDISDVFSVTAVVTNNTDENCDVEAELFVTGPAGPVGGSPSYPLGLIAPGQSKEVNWTLHCDGDGDVDLNVVAYGSCWDDECAEACASETVTVHQPPIEPLCDWDVAFPVRTDDDVCVCNNFYVTVMVTNNGTAPGNPDVTLQVTGGEATFHPSGATTETKSAVGTINPGDSLGVVFELHCDGAPNDLGDLCEGHNYVDFEARASGSVDGVHCYSDWVEALDYVDQQWIDLEITYPETCNDFCIQDEWYVDVEIENCYDKPYEGQLWLEFSGPAVVVPPPPAVYDIVIPASSTYTKDNAWHMRCTGISGGGDVTITAKTLGIIVEDFLTLCDDDTVIIHQKEPGDIDVDLDAPDCAKQCQNFDVIAVISYDGDELGSPIENIEATLSIVDPPGTTPPGDATIKSTNPVTGLGSLAYGDEPIVVVWEVHCDGCHDVEWKVTVTGDDALCKVDVGGDPLTVTATAGDTTRQVDFDVDIISPEPCEEVYVSDTFCVTVQLANNDCDTDCDVSAIHIELPNNAELAEGEDAVKYLPEGSEVMYPTDMHQVSWTVHCTGPGAADIGVWAEVDCQGCQLCETQAGDSVVVYQINPPLEVEILSPDDATLVATSEEFAVTARVSNTSQQNAYNVEVVLETGPKATVVGPGEQSPALQIVPFIGVGESAVVTWTVHCDGPGVSCLSVLLPGSHNHPSLEPIGCDELEGYYFSDMYDDSCTDSASHFSFMGEPEIADWDMADRHNDPDITDVIEWDGNCLTVRATDVDYFTTVYFLAKVIKPLGHDITVEAWTDGGYREADPVKVGQRGSFELWSFHNEDNSHVIDFVICADPCNQGVHIAATEDINYAQAMGSIPEVWWEWLTDPDHDDVLDDHNWAALDWVVSGEVPPAKPQVCVNQYPAAHLVVDIVDDTVPDEVVTCEEFTVGAWIENTGWADASEVYATLSVEPEGSVRVSEDDPDGGYTKFIGTIPGHGSPDNSVYVEWLLHCKQPCDSTITISVEGADEYGWHQKQECQSTGSFTIDYGEAYAEELEEIDGGDTGKEWLWFDLWGEAVGLLGPYNLQCEFDYEVGDDFICCQGDLNAYGIVDDGYMQGFGIKQNIVHCGTTEPCSFTEPMYFYDGYFQIINGELEGWLDGFISTGETMRVYLKNGTYCSTMASTPLLPIQDGFLEPDSITVKQLPASADLEIDKSADESEVTVGEMVTFTVSVTNNGLSEATGVMVRDVLPAGVNYESSTATHGWYDVTSGFWDLGVGALAEYGVATLDIQVSVNKVGEISNEAVLAASDQDDPNTSNNSESVTITGLEPEPVTSVEVTVDDEFSLISLPLIPEDTAIDTMTASLQTELEKIWYYDASTETWPVYNADQTFPDFSSLFEMEDGKGYWVKMVGGGGSFTFSGWELVEESDPPSVPPTYPVVEGWNLIGFKSVTPKAAAQYLASIEGKYVILYGYDNGSFFIVGTPGHEMLQPGLGYWIALKTGESGIIFP
jgi:uncharacterized repeat protein (TIGR01451 family)